MQNNRNKERLWTPPHAMPLNGSESRLQAIVKFIRNPLEGFNAKVYVAGITKHKLLSVKMHVVTSPEAANIIFKKQAINFRKSELNQRIMGPATKQGLIVVHGKQWQAQRRTIAPMFQHKHLITHSLHISEALEEFVNTLGECENELELSATMTKLTFNVLAKTLLGNPKGIDREKLARAAYTVVSETGTLRLDDFLPHPKWLPRPLSPRGYFALRALRKAANQLLLERKNQNHTDDLVGLLCHSVDPKTKRALTTREQRDNLIGFFIAGHETSALALTWALYLIGSHPETQERIQEEIRAVAGDGKIKFEQVNDFKFVNAVLNEAIRLFPPIPILGREATCDTQVLDTKIKKDEIVVIPLYVMHRSKIYWSNPNSFDPDRFLRNPTIERTALQFKPFGDGPRVCIGTSFAVIEAVMAIVTIVRKFEVIIDCEIFKPQVTASLRPSSKINVKFIKREADQN